MSDRAGAEVLAELRARISSIQGRPSSLGESITPAAPLVDLSAGADTPTATATVATAREASATFETSEAAEAAQPIATHPTLAHLLQVRPGASYAVDSASVALALLAGASAGGRWVAAVGWGDLGIEAAQQYGADLSRMVVVPDPGADWVEVTAALVDVVGLVALRPSGTVEPSRASVLAARLRTREAAMVVWGDWPRANARIQVERVSWSGLAGGTGRLVSRSAQLAVFRGAGPAVRGAWEPGAEPMRSAARSTPLRADRGRSVAQIPRPA